MTRIKDGRRRVLPPQPHFQEAVSSRQCPVKVHVNLLALNAEHLSSSTTHEVILPSGVGRYKILGGPNPTNLSIDQ